MAAKNQIIHEGKVYYSFAAAARLLGTTTPKLKQILIPEDIEFLNLRVNGPLWVSADDLIRFIERKKKSGP